MRPIFFAITALCLTACGRHATSKEGQHTGQQSQAPELVTDPIACFTGWAGGEPPADVKVFHGQYWESAHWTREYIVYLEMDWPKTYSEGYIKENKLQQLAAVRSINSDAPDWFRPDSTMLIWTVPGRNEATLFFQDPESEHVFLYERQL